MLEQEACTAALQNIAVDKVAVKLGSGGCPNTRWEIKSTEQTHTGSHVGSCLLLSLISPSLKKKIKQEK